MEAKIAYALDVIRHWNDPRAIKYVNTEIGIYRLNALSQYGLIRHLIHMDANAVERGLNKAIEEYKYNNPNPPTSR